MNNILNKLNKNDIYCSHCMQNNKITKLKLDINTNLVELCPIHNKMKGNFYIFVFDKNERNEWVQVRVRNPNKIVTINNSGICCKCGKYNKYRDKMNRGRDSYHKDDPEAKGCNCSYNFYFTHNNLQAMKESSSRIGKITIKYANEKEKYLWENDPIYREKIAKIRQENGRKNGKINGIKNVRIMNQKEKEKYENDPEYRKRVQKIRSENAKNYLIPY